MPLRTTADVIDQFNHAFVSHDPAALTGLIGDGCVMEAIQPAPDGARYEGREACLAFWRALAEDRTSQFEPEEVTVAGGAGHDPLAVPLRRRPCRFGARRQPHARA
jgi:hypothetical protein